MIRHIVHPLQASTLKYPGYQIGYITLGKQKGREERKVGGCDKEKEVNIEEEVNINCMFIGWILYALTVWLFGILLLVTVFAFVYAYTAVLLIISSIMYVNNNNNNNNIIIASCLYLTSFSTDSLTIIINILIQFIQSLTGRFLFIEGKEQRFVLTNRYCSVSRQPLIPLLH